MIELALAAKKQVQPVGARAVAITSELYKTRAEIDADLLISRLENLAIQQLNGLFSRGLDYEQIADEMQAFLAQLSEKPVAEIARGGVTEAFNLGRNVETMRQRSRIAFVIRTELLDPNTCKTCAGLDGKKYEVGSPAYFDNRPPRKCEGDTRCRGFYLVIGERA